MSSRISPRLVRSSTVCPRSLRMDATSCSDGWPCVTGMDFALRATTSAREVRVGSSPPWATPGMSTDAVTARRWVGTFDAGACWAVGARGGGGWRALGSGGGWVDGVGGGVGVGWVGLLGRVALGDRQGFWLAGVGVGEGGEGGEFAAGGVAGDVQGCGDGEALGGDLRRGGVLGGLGEGGGRAAGDLSRAD